jgi:hypothetical protein
MTNRDEVAAGNATDTDALIDMATVGERICCSRAKLYELMRNGHLPYVTHPALGGRYVKASDLRAFIAQATKPSSSGGGQ